MKSHGTDDSFRCWLAQDARADGWPGSAGIGERLGRVSLQVVNEALARTEPVSSRT